MRNFRYVVRSNPCNNHRNLTHVHLITSNPGNLHVALHDGSLTAAGLLHMSSTQSSPRTHQPWDALKCLIAANWSIEHFCRSAVLTGVCLH